MILKRLKAIFRRIIKFITDIISHLRITKLKNRFLLVMITLTFLPIVVVSTVSLQISRNTIERNHISSFSSNLYSFSRATDLVFENMIRDARQVLAHPSTQQELSPSATRRRIGLHFDINTVRALDQAVRSVTNSNKYIQSISIFDNNGRGYCYSRSTIAGMLSDANLQRDFRNEPWFSQVESAEGKEVFLGRNIFIDHNQGELISCVKLLKSITNFKPIGLLVISISNRFLYEQVPRAKPESDLGEFLITTKYDGQWDIFFTSKPPDEKSEMRRSLIESLADSSTKVIRQGNQLAIRYINSTTNWNVIHLIPISELIGDVARIRTWTFLIAIVMLHVVAVLFVVISGMLNRPLTKLETVIANVANGQRTISDQFGDDEIGQIGSQFKRLVNTNIDLKERLMKANLRQREAELNALQNQINPHFLYNTLDSIFWLAKAKKTEKVAEMTLALSKVFKLTLNNGREVTTVRHELEHIESYLAIQNHRYRGRFTSVIDVEDQIMECEILNLMLQPFVENAIHHGLEPKVGSGKLTLLGWKDQRRIIFEIKDDGIGMNPEGLQSEGFAITNVRERIHLLYGQEFGVWLFTNGSGGTTVRITLPFVSFRMQRLRKVPS